MSTPANWRLALFATAIVAGAAAPYNLTRFETELLPQWVAQYRLGPGNYSFKPHHDRPHPYGTPDVLHVLCFTGQLQLSEAERDAHAAVINSFQREDGFFSPGYPDGSSPGGSMWHAAGYVTAGLSLLDRFPARANTMFDRIAGDRSLWQPTIDALLDVDATPPPQNISGCKSGYSCAQNIASLLSWQIMTNNSAAHGGGLARYAAFASWYVDYLVSRVDTATGLWCEQHQQQKHGTINCIGGSFHVDFVLQYLALHPALVGGALARAARFPMPGAQLNTSLGLQRRDGGWTDSGMAYLNVDGIYQATRPSLQIGRARWNDVRAACDALLSKVVPALNNGTRLLDTGGLSAKTHNLPALVAAVAECQKHFGAEMVLTTRPWKMCLDDVPYI